MWRPPRVSTIPRWAGGFFCLLDNSRLRINPSELLAFIGLLAAPCLATAAPASDPAAERRINRFLDYAAAVRSEVLIPASCPFDPAAVVQRVGPDPDKLAAFVREKIRYEPYLGMVRGTAGTLAAASGGDWDRAVLLRALLTQAGFDSALKILPRSAAQSAAVVATFLAGRRPVRSLSELPDIDPAKLPPPSPLLARYHIPPGNRLAHLRQSLTNWRAMSDESLAAAATERSVLDASLAASGQPLTRTSFDQWRSGLLAGAAERVVVVLTTPEGQRILPIGPDPSPVPESDLSATEALTEVPDGRTAMLTLKLSMTLSGKDADAEPGVLLERSLPLGALFQAPPRLEIIPYDPKLADHPPLHWTQDDWFNRVAGFKQFLAIVRSGHDVTSSKLFDLNGQLHEIGDDGQVSDAQNLGGGIGGGFGGALGGNDQSSPPDTHLEALVLSIQLNLPGQAPVKAERLLFGRLRPGVSPVGSFDVLAVGGPVGPSTVAWLTLDALVADAPMIAAAYGHTGADPAAAVKSEDRVRLTSLLYEWQSGRLILSNQILAGHPDLASLNGPAIILQSERITIDEKNRAVGGRTAIDLIYDGQRIIPRSFTALAEATAANVTLGVASTVLESVLLGRTHPTEVTRGPYVAAKKASLSGQKPVVRLPGGAGRASPLAEWAVIHNEPDRLLVFPTAEGANTWWAVDPVTGATIGRGDDGEGQSTMEYLKVTKENLSNLKCCLGFLQGFLKGNQQAAEEYLYCITGTDNNANIASSYAGFLGTMAEGFEASGDFFGQVFDVLAGYTDLQDTLREGGG